MSDLLPSPALLSALVVMVPLLLAVAMGVRRLRGGVRALAPWAALPGLYAALAGAPLLIVDDLLLGMRLGSDRPGAVFLLFTALVWLLAGLQARTYLADDPRRDRFQFFFLLTQCGNLGVVLALDVVTFYMFFTLMTFAAYGLVVHAGTEEARYAGRVYLSLAVLGEALLLGALLLAATAIPEHGDLRNVPQAVAELGHPWVMAALGVLGFGIKLGLLGLHVWLPLAHPVAPTPASAVLSGAIIKAGLLGLLRFLPLGELAMPGWGTSLVILGLSGAFYAVGVGLVQRDPKVVLAYSSVSQMGLIAVALGVGLMRPQDWPWLLGGILAYALHHALAKGALFLGVAVAGATHGRLAVLLVGGLILPAAALAGAPLTGGALAKGFLKESVALLPGVPGLALLLSLSATATALLMGRFLFLVWPRGRGSGPGRSGLWLPWVLAVVAAVALTPLVAAVLRPDAGPMLGSPGQLWNDLWPLGLAALIGGLWWWRRRHFGRHSIPPGDVLVPASGLIASLVRIATRVMALEPPQHWRTLVRRAKLGAANRLGRAETALAQWSVMGLVLVVVGLLLAGTLFADR